MEKVFEMLKKAPLLGDALSEAKFEPMASADVRKEVPYKISGLKGNPNDLASEIKLRLGRKLHHLVFVARRHDNNSIVLSYLPENFEKAMSFLSVWAKEKTGQQEDFLKRAAALQELHTRLGFPLPKEPKK